MQAATAFPTVIEGRNRIGFNVAGIARLAAVHNVSVAATARVLPRVGSWRECLSTFGPAAKAGNDRRRFSRGAAERVRRFYHRLSRVSYSYR
jgi:hypothetical protein